MAGKNLHFDMTSSPLLAGIISSTMLFMESIELLLSQLILVKFTYFIVTLDLSRTEAMAKAVGNLSIFCIPNEQPRSSQKAIPATDRALRKEMAKAASSSLRDVAVVDSAEQAPFYHHLSSIIISIMTGHHHLMANMFTAGVTLAQEA